MTTVDGDLVNYDSMIWFTIVYLRVTHFGVGKGVNRGWFVPATCATRTHLCTGAWRSPASAARARRGPPSAEASFDEAPCGRLFLPATSFDRFAVTPEINDGRLAPRFLPAMRHRPEDGVEDEAADLLTERLPGVLVVAEVLAGIDAARRRLVGGL